MSAMADWERAITWSSSFLSSRSSALVGSDWRPSWTVSSCGGGGLACVLRAVDDVVSDAPTQVDLGRQKQGPAVEQQHEREAKTYL